MAEVDLADDGPLKVAAHRWPPATLERARTLSEMLSVERGEAVTASHVMRAAVAVGLDLLEQSRRPAG